MLGNDLLGSGLCSLSALLVHHGTGAKINFLHWLKQNGDSIEQQDCCVRKVLAHQLTLGF